MTVDKHDVVAGEAELEPVLRNFRQSVQAWSEAEYGRPRRAVATARHMGRMALVWALGCVVAIGSLSVGVYEGHHPKESGKEAAKPVQPRPTQQQGEQAQSSQATHEKTAAVEAEPAPTAESEDSNLFAAVDTEVSRQVPSAMEPLAQLMESNSSQ